MGNFEEINLAKYTNGLTKDNQMEVNRFFSKIRKEAKSKIKVDKCIVCNEMPGTCNSHTVPQFVLRNISNNGRLNYWNMLQNTNLAKEKKGVNEAETFKLLCRKCDGSLFQEYESEKAYDEGISQKIMLEIALKSHLNEYAKKTYHLALCETMKEYNPWLETMDRYKAEYGAELLSVSDCRRDINILLHGRPPKYELIYQKKISYKIPFAVQDYVYLVTGFSKEVINDIYNYRSDYRMIPLYICIFPMKSTTDVIVFLPHNGVSRYKKFIKKFNRMSDGEKLHVLLYIVLKYTDGFLLAGDMDKRIKNIKQLNDVFKTSQMYEATVDKKTDVDKKILEDAVEEFLLCRYKTIPNLMIKEFCC
ncbi:MAG: hypothetical protein E7200_02045 [Selenomonas ruminantium]|nr:hypothetical protein [Selenomonas ruminantium]